ncbi:uncharacterized protein LOC124372062 [Homalodisca vitripennis]|uniref:uncharacterized protein LOC124372062 n=1 Tax=Homalodisca vitripennis TaxID=197043 RepID=UPI001EEBCC52|nr:uncharacterized protein LOC124372062 [Homalodisca vitripennis]
MLDLGYCTDQPAAFTSLVLCLERAPLLEHLELSCPEVDDSMLRSLYQLPLQVLRLPGTRVTNFPLHPPPIHQMSCLSLAAPAWASLGPFGLITNNTCPSV